MRIAVIGATGNVGTAVLSRLHRAAWDREAIERSGYDSLGTRARVAAADRVGILWKAWRGLPDDDAAADRPCVSWEHVPSESLRVAEHHVA